MDQIKFLYVDDEPVAKLQKIVRALNQIEGLEIEPIQVLDWDSQIKYILKNQNKFDGIILDLRLNEQKNAEIGKVVKYRGIALAQELRTLATEKKELKRDFPITLCSANYKFKESYNPDSTGHNLFDLTLEKDLLASDSKNIGKKLISLAKGYKKIRKNSSPEHLLNYNSILNLDEQLVNSLKDRIPNSKHEFSIFFLQNVLEHPGYLIDELGLASRLGVDIENSKDWELLVGNFFSVFKYSGVFSDGWQRWWWHEIERWWEEEFEDSFLRRTKAEERVRCLKTFSNLKNLVPPKPLQYASGKCFWNVCEGTRLPLDPIDSFVIVGQDNLYPWQDKRAVSAYAIIERKNKEKWKDITPLEKKRIERFKENE